MLYQLSHKDTKSTKNLRWSLWEIKQSICHMAFITPRRYDQTALIGDICASVGDKQNIHLTIIKIY